MHHWRQIHYHTFNRLAPAERQYLAHQITATDARLADFLDAHQCRGIALDILAHQLGIAENGRNDVVEIMCNATGQRADRRHFLRLAHLRLK